MCSGAPGHEVLTALGEFFKQLIASGNGGIASGKEETVSGKPENMSIECSY